METSTDSLEKMLGIYKKKPSLRWKPYVKAKLPTWDNHYKGTITMITLKARKYKWEIMAYGLPAATLKKGMWNRAGVSKTLEEAKLAVREVLHRAYD